MQYLSSMPYPVCVNWDVHLYTLVMPCKLFSTPVEYTVQANTCMHVLVGSNFSAV